MNQRSSRVQQRAFLRHPSEMPIHIQCEGHPETGPRHLRNVSLGGLACRSEAPIDVGREVSVEIPVGHDPFRAIGAVVWCRPDRRCYELGIQFLAQEDMFAARMVEQLCQIERYRAMVARREGRLLSSAEAAQEWIMRYAANFPRMD
ncbi:MAG: pilus assembly protein PilZ [Candidatus Dactylopiibacterium carminicum]|uniref:PilZ domain-containing protein n=1 Tax=Candidatus Dactylopiibacterium carminicum TaxID=857335 RepID=A0A272EW78_9RHOO|nr:PilZ domain-containing protein [Candidatus Dactylopiibacterium carminicum]KAF7599490.1 PilZ domain-containing protein [Candidatus Dactylopiibacterium carminicum]PAS94316.1 MAG: pilus assembly protein PilZ [Candidatus Dactylopiibacterium carminicum]PAS98510.1 MAG: pilus assembly protein PilZ [Candidatus Dactylopiibacterium carminicum]PAS99499.1 MAG: pilus assembly protein PilZ [Candidatus Dactylopiibacterium carminicum]